MNVATIVVPNDFFAEMECFLSRAINSIQSKNIKSKDIEIFMPEYFVRLYGLSIQQNYGLMSFGKDADEQVFLNELRFMGVLIHPNYENSIVVSHKHLLLRKEGKIEKLLIPNGESVGDAEVSIKVKY